MKRWFQVGVVTSAALTALIFWRAWVFVEEPYRRSTAAISAARDLPEYPPILVKAVLAAEDPSFIEDGRLITVKRIVRTFALRDIGSTHAILSHQFVRRFIEPSRASTYAVQWFLTAVLVDLTASKPEIISAYLSSAYTGSADGSPMYGFSEAARRYFGKQLDALTTSESAMLAGLLRSPSHYSPFTQRAAAEQRAVVVLGAMRQHGFISEDELDEATHLIRGLPPKFPAAESSTSSLGRWRQVLAESRSEEDGAVRGSYSFVDRPRVK